MMAVRAELNEAKGESGEVEAGRGNAARPGTSDRKLEDAVQRSMNDLELERERQERERPGFTAPARHVRNGSHS